MGSTEGFSVARGTGACVVPSSAGTISTTWNSSRAISPRQIFREREEHHPITPPQHLNTPCSGPPGGVWGGLGPPTVRRASCCSHSHSSSTWKV